MHRQASWLTPLCLAAALAGAAQNGQEDLSVSKRSYPTNPPLAHLPPSPLFAGRTYPLELFVDLPTDSIVSVSCFHRAADTLSYQQTELLRHRGRYRFVYEPKRFNRSRFSYFFVVEARGGAAYAVPINEKGTIVPVTLVPVPPTEAEFDW